MDNMARRAGKKLGVSYPPVASEVEENSSNDNNRESGAVSNIANDMQEEINEVLDKPKLSSTQRMADLKPHKVAKALRKCGAKLVRSGSHHIYEKDGNRSPVPLGHKTVNWRTLKDSLRTLGISEEDFIKYL